MLAYLRKIRLLRRPRNPEADPENIPDQMKIPKNFMLIVTVKNSKKLAALFMTISLTVAKEGAERLEPIVIIPLLTMTHGDMPKTPIRRYIVTIVM